MKKYLWLFLLVPFLIPAVASAACPTGYTQSGNYCCSNKYETPASSAGRQFCQSTQAQCAGAGFKFCGASNKNLCCPSNNSCGIATFGTWPVTADLAVCIPPKPTAANCNTGSTLAGKTSNGVPVYCCNDNEEPGFQIKQYPQFPYCQPKAAQGGACRENGKPGTVAVGTGAYTGDKRCCIAGQTPNTHPNTGVPFCADNSCSGKTGAQTTCKIADFSAPPSIIDPTPFVSAPSVGGTPPTTGNPPVAGRIKPYCDNADLQTIVNLKTDISNLDQWLANNPLNPLNLGLRFLVILRRWVVQRNLTDLENSCQPAPIVGKGATSRSQLSCFSGGTLPSQLSGLSPDILKQIMDAACGGGVRVP